MSDDRVWAGDSDVPAAVMVAADNARNAWLCNDANDQMGALHAAIAAAFSAARPAEADSVTLADSQRRAFIRAARELLGHEIMVEIWARAAELGRDTIADGAR